MITVGVLEVTKLTTTVSVLKGSMEWMLIKTDLMDDFLRLCQAKPLTECMKTKQRRETFWNSTLKNCYSFYGEGPMCFHTNLSTGDTMFVPEGWALMSRSTVETFTLWERKLLDPGLETYAASGPLNSAEMHQHNINKLIKTWQSDDTMLGLWQRMTKAMKQINKYK